MLFARGYPVHALLLIVVSLGSLAWIEYVARSRNETKAALIAGGVVAALVITHPHDRRG